MRSTERLICLLKSVNATAINNNVERGYGVGDHIAELCREAAEQLEQYHEAFKNRSNEIEEAIFGGNPDHVYNDIADATGWQKDSGDHGC